MAATKEIFIKHYRELFLTFLPYLNGKKNDNYSENIAKRLFTELLADAKSFLYEVAKSRELKLSATPTIEELVAIMLSLKDITQTRMDIEARFLAALKNVLNPNEFIKNFPLADDYKHALVDKCILTISCKADIIAKELIASKKVSDEDKIHDLNILLNLGANPDNLTTGAIKSKNMSIIQLLVDNGANLAQTRRLRNS